MTDTFRQNSMTKLPSDQVYSLYPGSSSGLGESGHGFTAGEEIKRWDLLSIQDKGVSGHEQTVEMRNFLKFTIFSHSGLQNPPLWLQDDWQSSASEIQLWLNQTFLWLICCDWRCETPFFPLAFTHHKNCERFETFNCCVTTLLSCLLLLSGTGAGVFFCHVHHH